MELVKAAMAASGVAGSLGTVAMYKLTSAITKIQVSKAFDDEGDRMRKKLRGETKFNDDTREEAMRSAGNREVTTDMSGALTNIPTEEQSSENRLVQVNTPGQGLPRDPRGGRKRLRGQDDIDRTMDTSGPMEIENGDQQLEAARFGGGGGDNPQSKETPITRAPSISYGLPNTHTTIIPWNFWFGMAHIGNPQTIPPPKLSFRLNSIDDIVETALSTIAAGGSIVNGVFNVPVSGGTVRAATNPAVFPRTITNGVSATERAFWVQYWKDIYEYYTVLGCEYKITANNVSAFGQNSSALIITDMDSYSDTAGSTGNRTPDVILAELLSFQHMKVRSFVGTQAALTSQEPYEVITGRYKPGDIARNISNDGDVKTWTKTDGTLPTLKDLMNIRLARSPFNLDNTGGGAQANFQVEVKYIVQFKDLKIGARYPSTGVTGIAQVLPNDALDAV